MCKCDRPDSASGVAEDRGSKALSDADQAGPIDLHYQIIHLDPSHTDTRRMYRCLTNAVVKHYITYMVILHYIYLETNIAIYQTIHFDGEF